MKAWTSVEGNLSVISRSSTANNGVTITNNNTNNLVAVSSKFRRDFDSKLVLKILVLIIIILLIVIIFLAISYWAWRRRGICSTSDCIRASSTLSLSMNRSVNPCEDFYQYACGGWHLEHPRPHDALSYDWFNDRQSRVLRHARDFLRSKPSMDEPKPLKQARMMYKACMDIGEMESLSYTPIISYLRAVHMPVIPTFILEKMEPTDTLSNLTEGQEREYDWIRSSAAYKRILGADLIIGFAIYPHPKNGTYNMMLIGSPEATNPLPSYTELSSRLERSRHRLLTASLESSTRSAAAQRYLDFIRDVSLVFIKSVTDSEDKQVPVDLMERFDDAAEKIYDFEEKLYDILQQTKNITLNVSESDPTSAMKELTAEELQIETNLCLDGQDQTTQNSWTRYLTRLYDDIRPGVNITKDKFLVDDTDIFYLCSISRLVAETPVQDLELYSWWQLMEALAVHTTKEMRNLYDGYTSKVLKKQVCQTRTGHCTAKVNDLMGMALGYTLADVGFIRKDKPRVELMLANIRRAFEQALVRADWLDERTRRATRDKSRRMKSYIGFPDWLLEEGGLERYYDGVIIGEYSHMTNMIEILDWRMRTQLKSLHQPNEYNWATDPTSVNAFHTFQANAITVPIAILQYPFYHLGLEALNYGAIGSILGHELTHGFDDSGRQYDKEGNLRQWWSEKTVEEYVEKTQCFIKQYSAFYMPDIGEYINGELTLGENIADNGGLREAFSAYQLYVQEFGKEQLLPGFEDFSHEQLFFLSYGNLWCETSTPESSLWSLEDEHCPGKYRLRGVLTNSEEFSKAWKCKTGTGMNPDNNKCTIW